EIGDLPLEMQVKLLRVLENRSFRRVGGAHDLEFSGRVVAATNKDLEAAVRDGAFREDLLFRLNTLTIRMPPLREHPEDVSMLAYMFATEEAEAIGRSITHIDKAAMDCLEAYHWRQNNVRELRNTIVRMVVGTSANVLRADLLPAHITGSVPESASARRPDPATPRAAERRRALVPELPPDLLAMPYSQAKVQAEQVFGAWYVDALLRRSGGNVTEAAKQAGQRRPNFHRLMKRYKVRRPPDQSLDGGD
ncbi:MAG: sigma 54-interacting transcriptional regulator, partial [Myxococcota bacterium]